MISVYLVSVQDEQGPAWAFTIPQIDETDYGDDNVAQKKTTYTAMSLGLVQAIEVITPHLEGCDGINFYTNKGKMLEQIFERKGLINSSIKVGALTVKALKKISEIKKKVYLTEHVEPIDTLSLHLAGYLKVTPERALDLIGIEKRAKLPVYPVPEHVKNALHLLNQEVADDEIIHSVQQLEAFIKRNGGITAGMEKGILNMLKD